MPSSAVAEKYSFPVSIVVRAIHQIYSTFSSALNCSTDGESEQGAPQTLVRRGDSSIGGSVHVMVRHTATAEQYINYWQSLTSSLDVKCQTDGKWLQVFLSVCIFVRKKNKS